MSIRLWNTTPGSNNSAAPNGWPEGQLPSTVNDCGRQMMAEIRDTCEQLPYFDFGDTPTRVDNDTFTVATDLTARYPVGARLKLVGATTGYATITASSYSAPNTTVDVVMDSGNVPTSLTTVSVSICQGVTLITPTLLNSWVNFTGADTPAPARYFKDAFGVVHLSGMVKNGSSLTAVIMNLPAGYRPAYTHYFASVSNDVFARLDVRNSGDVAVGASSGSTTYVSLDGISFPTI